MSATSSSVRAPASAPTKRESPAPAQHFLSLLDLDAGSLRCIFERSAQLKADPARFSRTLAGRAVVLLFEKPSLRTRVAFEIGVAKLGGSAVHLDHTQSRIGRRESVEDYARNLERWADVIVARTFEHATIEALARASRAPVINALSDARHPCQALADCFTLLERFGSLDSLRLAYIGDGNNVCHSLMLGAGLLGVRLTVVCPPGFEPDAEVVNIANKLGQASGGSCAVSHDLEASVAGAHAVYTDVWASMGQDAEAQRRREVFAPYQVTARVMERASAHAVFMHCLPAHRGEEVAAEVIDSPRSVVFDQAENRMHTQNALLLRLLSISA